jgi:hypothetical protein
MQSSCTGRKDRSHRVAEVREVADLGVDLHKQKSDE